METEESLKILVMVVIGLFFPFFFAVGITYGFDLPKMVNSFAYLLLVFCIEAIIVYVAIWKGKRKTKGKRNKKFLED